MEHTNSTADEAINFPETERTPPQSVFSFKRIVEQITAAGARIDQVYPQMIRTVEPFDRVLASKLAAAAKADSELMDYLKQKVEAKAFPQTNADGAALAVAIHLLSK